MAFWSICPSRVSSRWPLLNIFLPFQRAIAFSTSHLGHSEEWSGATRRRKSRRGPHLLNEGGYKDLRVNTGQRRQHSSLRTPVQAGDGRGDLESEDSSLAGWGWTWWHIGAVGEACHLWTTLDSSILRESGNYLPTARVPWFETGATRSILLETTDRFWSSICICGSYFLSKRWKMDTWILGLHISHPREFCSETNIVSVM